MITSFQMRAARALLGIDQKTLAELAGVSLPTIQRMEASTGTVRGVVDSLIKVVDALNRAGVELIGEHARSDHGGRGGGLWRASFPLLRERWRSRRLPDAGSRQCSGNCNVEPVALLRSVIPLLAQSTGEITASQSSPADRPAFMAMAHDAIERCT